MGCSMSNQSARIGKLATVGLCSGALLVGGASGASAESDNEDLLQQARAAGIGKVVTTKTVADRAAPGDGVPFSAQDLVDEPGFLVFDFYPDDGDGTSVPRIDEAAMMVDADFPKEAYGVSVTDRATRKYMTDNGSLVALKLDLNKDSLTDLLALTPQRPMKEGTWYGSTFGQWDGVQYVDSGIPVYWNRDSNAYLVSFDWDKLPKTNVAWIMGIVNEFGGSDFAPNDFGTPVQLDQVAPRTKITSGTSGAVDSRKAKFYFKSNEAKSTFECKLDGLPWQACVSPKVYKGLANGEHKFKVRATDKAGNTDPSPAVRKFTTARRIKVALAASIHRSKLLVDVDPNKASENYTFKVQKMKGGTWKTVLVRKTKGPKDRRTIDMGKGKYRVWVPAQFDMIRAKSTAVTLVK
jgi:hypothetical protein